MDKAEVKQTTETDAFMVTDAVCILVRCSRKRCFRDRPPDSVLEKQHRTNQPDSSRTPHSPSRLLATAQQRSRRHRTYPRVPSLEGVVHITILFVDPFQLREHGQNSRLPRTLWALPHPLVDKQRRRHPSPRSFLPGHAPCNWTTQIPDHLGNPKMSTRHHRSPISPCSSS